MVAKMVCSSCWVQVGIFNKRKLLLEKYIYIYILKLSLLLLLLVMLNEKTKQRRFNVKSDSIWNKLIIRDI
jgi:hypothetical protein